MQSIAFAIPVEKGKAAEARKMIDDLLSHQHDHHHSRQKDRGYSRIKVFHQTFPMEQFVIYAEAPDLAAAMAPRAGASGFEADFQKAWEALAGHHVDKVQPDIAELVMDWHEEKGGSNTHQ